MKESAGRYELGRNVEVGAGRDLNEEFPPPSTGLPVTSSHRWEAPPHPSSKPLLRYR